MRLVELPHVIDDQLDSVQEMLGGLPPEEHSVQDPDRIALCEELFGEDATDVSSSPYDQHFSHRASLEPGGFHAAEIAGGEDISQPEEEQEYRIDSWVA
jgi:hypothetical protein